MKKLSKALILEGILSITLACLMYYYDGIDNSIYLLYKPFDWIGKGLRWLSISSSIGNIIAFICYTILSLCPILYLIAARRKSRIQKIDILIPIISIFTFYMLYHFINPGLMLNLLPQMMSDVSILPVLKLGFAIIFYSLCIGYLFIRLLENLTISNTENRFQSLCQILQKILLAGSVLYTFLLGYFATFQMFAGLKKQVVETNTMPFDVGFNPFQDNATINQLFTVLKYLLQCLPNIFSIYILVTAIMLLKIMTSRHMKEEEINAATKLSLISKQTVYVTVFSNLALNIIQFLLLNKLSNTSIRLDITFSPLIIAFSAMILSGYFKEAKELQEDNEMII